MRFGIAILPDQRWSIAGERWRRADEYGFDHGWTYDHLGWRDLVDGPWFDSVATLSAAASVTARLRLGTFVASPNFRHPVHFAREITALDDLSEGRITIGLGAGTPDFDATVLGLEPLSPRQRVDRFGEFVELLDLLLTQERTTWHGDYFSAVDARSVPGCVQQPRVPFVVAANGPRSMRIAARFADNWVTTGPRTDDFGQWWRGVGAAFEQFTAALEAAKRATGIVGSTLNLDSAPVYSLSSVGAFDDAVGRAAAIGFTDVVTHWPRESSWYAGSEAVLDAVAAEVLPRLRG
jgi:alkanesulfonate monooxygenase SsuD/methylene tetrahydromethanopterin reductase-like flavin-dependent oxidoreductase (luciferase family)